MLLKVQKLLRIVFTEDYRGKYFKYYLTFWKKELLFLKELPDTCSSICSSFERKKLRDIQWIRDDNNFERKPNHQRKLHRVLAIIFFLDI